MSPDLDLITVALDLLSILILILVVVVAWKTARGFRQSRQAVTESASLLGVIVDGLTSRIESSESVVATLRADCEAIATRNVDLESRQSGLQGSYLQVMKYLQDALSNDKRLILELEQLKSRLTSVERRPPERAPATGQIRAQSPPPSSDITARLTPTEAHTLEILGREGPKAAPELGKRMRKSREHMARLMKKLYMDGYVDRESNHAPFRYKLNEKVRESLAGHEKRITAVASEEA